MTTNLAGAAASCTGTWAQKWNCGWKTSPGVTQAGYDAGRSLIPALAVLLVVILLVAATRRRKKGRSSAPATAGARR
jgi:hypothetical protein